MSVTAFLRRGVVEPLWAFYSGSPLLRAWRELERSQREPVEVLRERQQRRLSELLTLVYERNAFHRRRLDDAGVAPANVRSVDDLARLPLLTKKDIRAAGESLLTGGFAVDRLMRVKTGGSTGASLHLLLEEQISELRNACHRRCRRWTGWEVGEPVGAVWGNPQQPADWRGRLRMQLLTPSIFLDTMSVTEQSVKDFAAEWRRVRPTLLFGHAHSIFLLAELVRRLEIRDIRPRGVIATSMMLLPNERAVIEDVFGVRVFDFYGCEEVGMIAGECERHDGMHVNTDQLVVELVREDGRPAAPGEHGQVVVTDLLNRSFPLIRYNVEDMAEPMAGLCPCGRGLPLMRRVVGRLADFLVRRDGSRVAGVSLIENSLTRIPGIDQLQVVQEAIDRLRLRVVPDPSFSDDARAELVRYFSETFPGALVQVELTPAIAQEPNGKYRFSICRIPG